MLKKYLIILPSILGLFLLVGCINSGLRVRHMRISYDGNIYFKEIITSVEELNGVLLKDEIIPEDANYNEQFFEKYTLVIFNILENSGSIKHEIKSYDINGETITINIKRKVPGIGTDDMAQHVYILEIEQKKLSLVDKIELNIQDKK